MVYPCSSFVYMGISPDLTVQESGEEDGSEKQLLDRYIYPDSDFTEWKLVVPNVCISNFILVFAVKV